MWRKISGGILCSVCLLSACDKSDSSTASTATGNPVPVKIPADVVRPTTQQLLSGPRTNLNLKFVPMSLMVPQGWDVKSHEVGNDGPQFFLEGPTLTDDLRFRLPISRNITQEQETLLETHANESLAKNADLLGKSVVRDIAGARVIEQLTLRDLQPTPEELAANPAATTQPIHTVQWTFTVCAPATKGFTAYDLTVGMTLKQYVADHAFVRSIMDSLKFNPPVTGSTIQ